MDLVEDLVEELSELFLTQLGEVQVYHLQSAHNSSKQPAIQRDIDCCDDCDNNDDVAHCLRSHEILFATPISLSNFSFLLWLYFASHVIVNAEAGYDKISDLRKQARLL